MAVMIPASVGEVMDKLTILQIKAERITDSEKLVNIHNEIAALEPVCNAEAYQTETVTNLVIALKGVNEELWDIEDKIRLKEAAKHFDEDFIALARAVYVTNDRRAELKKQINQETGSDLVEEKSYQDYS